MTVDEKALVSGLAGPAVRVVRDLFMSSLPDEVRLAVLVEIAGAAASIARAISLGTDVDVKAIASTVTDPVDVGPVLGRGAWEPNAFRFVPLPPRGVKHPRNPRRAISAVEQLALFASLPSKEL